MIASSRDRFFEGGKAPLPPGTYRVTLHFAETHFQEVGKRRFDVLLEGNAVLKDHAPPVAALAAAAFEPFEVTVKDGLLEIRFENRLDFATVSVIEVERVH